MSNEYYFTIDDTSPYFNYTPFADGAGDGGWKTFYYRSGYRLDGQEGNVGSGESYHITSQPGASVSLSFYGTGFTLYGAANCSYQVVVDGQIYPQAPSSGTVLYSASELKQQSHHITLTAAANVTISEKLVFNSIVVVNELADSATTLVPDVINNQDTTALQYYGNWSINNDHQIPNSQNPAPYFETKSEGAGVSLTFTGSAIAVNGSTNYGNWVYQVELDGQSVATPNGSTWWLVPDALLFYQDGLDASQQHVLNITDISGGMNLWLNSITVYKPSSALPSSSLATAPTGITSTVRHSTSNVGTIAGGVVGALAGIIAIVLLILWWMHSTKRRRTSDQRDNFGSAGMGYLNGHSPQPQNTASIRPSRVHSISSGTSTSNGSAADLLRQNHGIRQDGPVFSPYPYPVPVPITPSISDHESLTSFEKRAAATPMTPGYRPLPQIPVTPQYSHHPASVDTDRLGSMVAHRTERSENLDRGFGSPPPEYQA